VDVVPGGRELVEPSLVAVRRTAAVLDQTTRI
jgi:hypothetical protein